MATSFLDAYEPLDIIGNGSFGIIRKARRKADGKIFAQKELNFERMSDRDKKQIVAEVNILKDLNHEHIVRYHDRYVAKEAGILYIIMEYCGGGDLSGVIKQAAKHNRPIPEDTIWNYFMQLLLALQYCHHPGSSSGKGGTEGECRRPQILHRDLKPDNVFLDESNTVKLGDFGLSKALPQASFANTYVGTPYYMSPELMQEKSYDSKSDIWSLGCLIYELCALKPPFHEAKTHAELSMLIRTGRIPPLPRGYSTALTSVIKSMLNLNPAMRPSATQLLQHERLELAFKVSETEKLLATVKNHKRTMTTKERELIAREAALLEKEQQLYNIVSQKDAEIANLQQVVSQLQQQKLITQHDLEVAVKTAIARREEELRVLVMKREEEVAAAMAAREEEILAAVRAREAEVCEAWVKKEEELRAELEESAKDVEERLALVEKQEEALRAEEARLESLRSELEEKAQAAEETIKFRRPKTPLEEVKNLLGPLERMTLARDNVPLGRRAIENARIKAPSYTPPSALSTPVARPRKADVGLASAMKGIVLTATGEALATPAPVQLTSIIMDSPKVGLNFGKIFDFDEEADRTMRAPSPSSRKEKEKLMRDKEQGRESPAPVDLPTCSNVTANPPTKMRRPSVRKSSGGRPSIGRSVTVPSLNPDSGSLVPTPTTSAVPISGPTTSSSSSSSSTTSSGSAASSTSASSTQSAKQTDPKPVAHSHHSGRTQTLPSLPFPRPVQPPPEYDFTDEENLPSPFLRRIERAPTPTGTAPSGHGLLLKKKRSSGGHLLRAATVANMASRKTSNSVSDGAAGEATTTRPPLANTRKVTEDTRKVLRT
ncbi:hypothetical protein AX16_005794 [Volvariella volvacea WC 439]|nr:hypothetical protein AX16_005794 [Volvariella volvacea WC 439]